MKILIVHGYFLSGTGSNQFVRKLAKALSKQGHEIEIFSQDDDINLFKKFNIVMHKPKINLLPVYVYDNYPNYEVKEMHNLSREKIENYIDLNSKHMTNLLNQNNYDLIISNHLVLQPNYVHKAILNSKYQAIKHYNVVHGSDLHFSISKSELLKDYAFDNLKNVQKIICVSNSSKNELQKIMGDVVKLNKSKINVLNSGVDANLYKVNQETKTTIAQQLSKKITETSIENCPSKFNQAIKEDVQAAQIKYETYYDKFNLKAVEVGTKQFINAIENNDYVISFVGKYLETKGITQLLLALPLITKIKNLKVIIVGFGNWRINLAYLISIFETQNAELFIKVLENPSILGINLESSIEHFKYLKTILNTKEKITNYLQNAAKVVEKVHFTGYFTSQLVASTMQLSDQFIGPSVYSESFGMVGIEALSTGCVTSLSYQTGFKNMIDSVENNLDIKFNIKIEYDQKFIINIAKVIENNYDYKLSFVQKTKINEFIKDNFSWESLALKIIK